MTEKEEPMSTETTSIDTDRSYIDSTDTDIAAAILGVELDNHSEAEEITVQKDHVSALLKAFEQSKVVTPPIERDMPEGLDKIIADARAVCTYNTGSDYAHAITYLADQLSARDKTIAGLKGRVTSALNLVKIANGLTDQTFKEKQELALSLASAQEELNREKEKCNVLTAGLKSANNLLRTAGHSEDLDIAIYNIEMTAQGFTAVRECDRCNGDLGHGLGPLCGPCNIAAMQSSAEGK